MKNLSRFEIGMIIAFAVVALLGGAAATYLNLQLGTMQQNLSAAQAQVTVLSGAQQYTPSAANIKVLTDNATLLKSKIDPLVANQLVRLENTIFAVKNQDIIPWKNDLDTRVKKLTALAKQNQVTLPTNFYFGFSRYLSNNPQDSVTGALTKELIYTEQVCQILIGARINELKTVQRSYDEDEPWSEGGTARSGDQLAARMTTSENGTYITHPLAFVFVATARPLRKVLSDLAASPYVFIVRSLKVENSRRDAPRLSDLGEKAAAIPIAPPPTADPNSPGAAASDTTVRSQVAPEYLFGSETLTVRLRVDAIEWQGLPKKPVKSTVHEAL